MGSYLSADDRLENRGEIKGETMHFRFKMRRSRLGFTLVESLVIVGCLTTLSGLMFPAVETALDAARRAKCQHNLRQITVALLSYTADHNGVLPVAAPQELGGIQGKGTIFPAMMFGGALPAEKRPLNTYVESPEVFRSPCDRGEPLWWLDSSTGSKPSTCYELYGSSYFYASGFNQVGGVVAPMGIAKFVGVEFSYKNFAQDWLPLGQALRVTSYPHASKKVIVGSIPIHRTMSGVVAMSKKAQWYKNDPDHLWANAAFLDGHIEFVRAFPYDAGYASVFTQPDENNPYF